MVCYNDVRSQNKFKAGEALNFLVSYATVLRVVTQRSSPLGGALRDDPKNGFVGD